MSVTTAWHEAEILGFDFETTGVDRFTDVPVSFALVTIEGGEVRAAETRLVDPGREIPAAATRVHGITTERARREGIPLAEAIAAVADAVVAAGERGTPVAGMRIDYDLTILDVQHRAVRGGGLAEAGWSGLALDVSVLDRHFDRFRKGSRTLGDLCRHYQVTLTDAHDAVADAAASVQVLRAMCDAFPELASATLDQLARDQRGWHEEWAVSYSEWRERNGKPPLSASEHVWPIAPRG